MSPVLRPAEENKLKWHMNFIVLSVFAVHLIAPSTSFTYSIEANVKHFFDNSDNLKSTRRLQVLVGENPDGTLLVAVDEEWPPVRIAVQSLLDCNLTYPDEGFKPGSILSIESSLFVRVPILMLMVQAPLHHLKHSVAEPSANLAHISDGQNIRRAFPDRSSIAVAEKMDDGLRNRDNLCPQLTIRAPILLNLSYYGSHRPKPGDKMTWVYSIQQGSVPLSWMTLRFYDSTNDAMSYISRNISVPWNFQSTSDITSGSITYKVRGSELSGTFILFEIVLATQACPDYVYTNYQNGGWIYYSYNYNPLISTVIGPQTHCLHLLSGNATSYVLGSTPVLTVKSPELLEFKYIGNFSVAWGEELIWEYKVRQGTFALSAIKLNIYGPTLQHSQIFDSFPRSLSFDVRSDNAAAEGTNVTGRLSWKVTKSWLEGEYLRGRFSIRLECFPSDQNYFMVPERTSNFNYYFERHFQVFYFIEPPYNQVCHRYQYVGGGIKVSNCIIGDLSFQVNGVASASLAQPLLLLFNYTGPAVVDRHKTLTWRYKISAPSIGQSSIVVLMTTCGPDSYQGPCHYASLKLWLPPTPGKMNNNRGSMEWEGVAEAEVAGITPSFDGTMTWWYQGVELRSPAQEGSDVILTSYYTCSENRYWNGYNYSVSSYYCNAGSYTSFIPGAPTSVPADVAIRDESGRRNRIFRFVDANCPERYQGPLCQGSGIRPNTTDGPPAMLGDGPCELPFLDWQVTSPCCDGEGSRWPV